MKLIINENMQSIDDTFSQNKSMIEKNKNILEVRNSLQILLLQRSSFEAILSSLLVRIDDLKLITNSIYIIHAFQVLTAQYNSINILLDSTNMRIEELNNLSIEMVTDNSGESNER